MITDSDIKKLKKVFVTKEELKSEIKSTENYLNYKIEAARKESQEFIREFHKFKDSTLKTLDWLVGAFKKFEEEYTVIGEQLVRINKRLDQHEQLLTC